MAQGLTKLNTIAVTQATGSNLHTVVDSGTITTVSAVTAISNALPAGTNAIGKLAANSGVDIGDVTIDNASGASAVNVQDGGNSITVDNGGTFAIQQTTATIPTATTMQNAATANGNGTSLNVSGYATAILNVVSSVAMSGGTTVNFEASVDDTTWVAISGHSVGTTTTSTTTTSDGDFRLNVAGYKSIRARISAYSAGTITVKGYTIQAVGIPTFLKVDPTGTTTQPVSLSSVPSHAVTNAGTFAVQATVAAAATNIAKAEDVGSADADVGVPAMAVRKATPANTSGTDGDYEFLQMSAGRLWASATIDAALPAGTALVGKVGIDQTTVGTTNAISLAQLGANTVATGNGVSSTGVLRVAQVNDGTGVIATVSAVTAITNALPAGTNLVGDVGIQPRTTNGLDTFMASGSDGSSILVATAQAVKASAGKVYGYYLYNPEAAVTFVHFYNTASGSVTVGTTNPLFTLQIPAGSAANLMSEIGITFGTAITIAATTTAGGNTAPATGVSATIFYK